jgi:hypothetical protein
MVSEIRPEERRMTLSIRKMERDKERRRVREVLKAQEDEGRVTIGDIAGALLQQAVGPRSDGEGQGGGPDRGSGEPAGG